MKLPSNKIRTILTRILINESNLRLDSYYTLPSGYANETDNPYINIEPLEFPSPSAPNVAKLPYGLIITIKDTVDHGDLGFVSEIIRQICIANENAPRPSLSPRFSSQKK